MIKLPQLSTQHLNIRHLSKWNYCQKFKFGSGFNHILKIMIQEGHYFSNTNTKIDGNTFMMYA